MNLTRPFILFLICFLLQCMILRGNKVINDLDLEKEIKLLNKPAVKIIKTKYGETYGCIDFYKQPAFDHPLLKNHSFHYQMRPTSYPSNTKFEESTTKKSSSSIWLNGKGCPVGTVPIRRISKYDIIRSKLYSKSYPHLLPGLIIAGEDRFHHAVIRTKSDSPKKYNGGGAVFGIQNPLVLPFQYSACQMKIKGGTDFVQVGWMVNPILYPDNLTHLFTFTKTAESYCYNTLCNGIVLVSPDEPLDQILEPVTIPGGEVYDIKLYIFKDPKDKNWWLQVGHENKVIAFWPNKIFTGLATFASGIEWGGETYSIPGLHSPPMGFGNIIPDDNSFSNAFGKQVSTINEEHFIVNEEDTETFVDNSSYYDVVDRGTDVFDGHWFVFGGPGGI